MLYTMSQELKELMYEIKACSNVTGGNREVTLSHFIKPISTNNIASIFLYGKFYATLLLISFESKIFFYQFFLMAGSS